MKKLALLLLLLPVLHACKKETKVVTPPLTVTDVDGNVYKTIKIGTQTWMAENLKTTKYRDKSPITDGTVTTTWVNNTDGAYCNYFGDAANGENYGHLYNWYAVVNTKNLAPEGWHVPSEAEFETLIAYVKNGTLTQTEISNALRETGITHWESPNTGATNSTGFTALASGYRNVDGTYFYLKVEEDFWSSGTDSTYGVLAYFDSNTSSMDSAPKRYGLSIRCVKD